MVVVVVASVSLVQVPSTASFSKLAVVVVVVASGSLVDTVPSTPSLLPQQASQWNSCTAIAV